MNPTNHLRWKQKERIVPANSGQYGDFRQKKEHYNVLEQFWKYNVLDLLERTAPYEQCEEMLGEWKEIEVVK